nr:MAG TPA: minor capsid protein [Caudoviricetes sp.]
MLSDYQKEQLSAEIIPMFQDLEQDTIQDIARRLRKAKRWTESAELQAKALESLGYSPSEIQTRVLDKLHADKDFIEMLNENTLEHKKLVRERIRETVDSAQAHGDKIIGRAGDMSFADDVAFWKTKGQHLKSSPALKQISAESSKRLEHELKSLTHSTGFKFIGAPVSVDQAFNHSMDKAVMNVASGAFSSEQAVEQVVSELEKSGLRYVNYASGITRGIDVAAHLAVRTTLNQMAADISMSNAEQLGTDLVEVSSHGGARDGDGHANHAGWQGKVYSISGKAHPKESKRLGYKILSLEAVTGYPHDPAGLCGYNCKHTFYPFIEGISDPTPIEKEPEPVKVDGRTYTFYQATQYQRRLERELREFKRQYLGGQNMTAAITAKEQQYARFCEKAGLKQNLNRLYVKGYKRDFEYIKPLISKPKNDIIESKRSIIHLSKKEDLSNYELTKIAPAQNKHVVGTNSYKNLSETKEYPPSYLTIPQHKISELVTEYAGKGINIYDSHGNWTHTEIIVTNDEEIGVVINNLNGETQETSVFKIHYSQKGVHIVPDYMNKKQRYTI